MSSLLRLIKKKFQPIKRHLTCSNQVAAASSSRSSSSSFEDTPEKAKRQHQLNNRSKAIQKRSKSSSKANKKTKKTRNAIQRTPNELKRMSNKTMSPTPSTLIFDSPNSRTTARAQPQVSYALDSISNVLSPNFRSYNVDDDGQQSMITFKTAFVMKNTPAANAAVSSSNFDDDGLIAHPSSVRSKINQEEKYTNATYTVQKKEQPAAHNSRIVDYFKHLEMRRAVKRKCNMPSIATTRKIIEKKEEKQSATVAAAANVFGDLNDELVKESTEIERIKEEFFNDESSHDLTPKPPTPCRSLLHTTSSPLSSISANSFTSSSPAHSTSHLDYKCSGVGDLSENPFMNRSIEKIRRSVSSPKIITNLNSTAAAAVISNAKNVSGVSLIREENLDVDSTAPSSSTSSSSSSASAATTIKLNASAINGGVVSSPLKNHSNELNEETTTLAPEHNENMTQSTIQPQPVPDHMSEEHNADEEDGEKHFVRGGGETCSRISTKLKHKFKNLIEHQTSAIQKVQMFYEEEINKIEMERVKILADIQCDDEQKKLINSFYDERLQMLEERVEAKLNMLKEKSNFEAKPPVSQDLNRVAQLMIIKLQKQQQQQQQQQQQPPRSHQSRTRTLSGVKASLVSTNQNNLLPPKAPHVSRRVDAVATWTNDDEVNNGDDEGEHGFKRNLSLRQKMSDEHQTKQKSPRASKLAYSSSRVSYNNESPSLNKMQARPPKPNAFVKNSAQKKQNMMESLRRAANQVPIAGNEADDEDSREAAGFRPPLDKSAFVATTTTEAFLNGPNYAQIKRDNQLRVAAMRPQSLFYGSSNFDSMSMYSLNSICYESNPTSQLQHLHHGGQSLYKYLSPRLSDGHLQYKMKFANYSRAGLGGGEFGNYAEQQHESQRLFHSHSHNHIVSMHETEV